MRLYWPVILIVWGIAKLIDNFSARRSGDARPPLLSGGEIALIILLFVAVTGMWGFGRIRDQLGDTDSFSWNDMWVKKGVPVSEDVPPGCREAEFFHQRAHAARRYHRFCR